jgi:alkylation response protein AidB-like acyl-CoA dehydrogenase
LPHLAGCRAVQLAGSAEQQRALLPAAARGELRLALARSREGGRFDRQGGRFYADEQDDGFLLFGEKLAVPGLAGAGSIVVEAVLCLPREIAAGLRYFVVEPGAPGVESAPLDTLEGGLQQASLRLTGTPVPRAYHLADGDNAAALARTEALIDLALVFDALGGAQRALELTVAFARLRTAFDQPIGTFQAVKHKCADMLYAVENLRSIAMWAAWVLDVPGAESGVDAPLATAMARTAAIESYDLVIRHATQVHGAIGVTAEHDLHLFARRSKTLALSSGAWPTTRSGFWAPTAWGTPRARANPAPEPARSRSRPCRRRGLVPG